MDAVTITFLVIGGIGVAALVLSLVFGGILDVDGGMDGLVSLPVIAGFIGALGFGGAAAATLTPGPADARVTVALIVGLVLAVPAALMAGRLVRAAMTMSTDATPEKNDLLGTLGTVVTRIPDQGFGEVRIIIGGQPVKVRAKAADALETGTKVFVVGVLSVTSVVVEATASIAPPDAD